jgi:hypothetical protein
LQIIVTLINTVSRKTKIKLEKGNLKGMFVSGNIPSGAEYKAALKDVLQAFPYFQLAQVLFAKQMYDTHEPEASGRIKFASVYAPDRKAMYLLFKSGSQQPITKKPEAIQEIVKTAEKGEVKYNFIYSSTTAENSGVMHVPPAKESIPDSLSEAFLRKEQEVKPVVPVPLEKPEKMAAQKPEEKKYDAPKIQPFISVDLPKEKVVAVEEKKVDTKPAVTTFTPPPKKVYQPPVIEKKKSPEPEKLETPPVKPLVSVKPPVEKPLPPIVKKVEEKKPEEKKPIPIAASGKKPYTPPTIEKKRNLYQPKPIEKKVEEPKKESTVIAKPPVIVAPSVPVPALEQKVIEKKTEQLKNEATVVEPIPIVLAAPQPVIEEKTVEIRVELPKVEVPAVEIPPVVITAPPTSIEEKVVEDKGQTVKDTIVEVITPVHIEQQPNEIVEPEKKIGQEVIAETLAKEEPTVINEPISDTNLKFSFNSWLKVLPEISVEKKPEVKPVSQEETADIIDKFLKKEPSISRPKAQFFSPVKAAKKSITEDDTIVSETLAKIYIAQGNLSKALKAYQTLLLQFPEKKNIFAPRIEELKTLMRENTKPGTK